MKKIQKEIMFKITYVIINLILVFGLLLPYLISSKTNEFVIAGFVVGIANGLHLIMFGVNLVKLIISSFNDDAEEGKSQQDA